MLCSIRRLTLVAGAAAAVVGMTAGVAIAAGDTDDSLSPASTSFTATNSGNLILKDKINNVSVTVTCTGSKLTAKTRASGLTADVTINPTFTGCKDNFGGTDTVTTSGKWSLTLVDNAKETAAEPNTGDQLTLNIPAGGAKFTSSLLPHCTVTVGASRPKTSSYNDKTTAVFTNASVNVSGSGCTASSPSQFSGTYKTSRNIGDLKT